MHLPKRAPSAFGLALLAVGCSESSSAPQAGTIGEIYTALCETSARCDGVRLSADACSLDRACPVNDIDIARPVEGAGTCAKEIRALSCTDYQGPVPDSSACLQAAVSVQRQIGASGEGGDCQGDDDCEFGLLCSSPFDDEACGSCVVPPSAGQACLGFRCGSGQYCDDSAICRDEHAFGAACSDSIECVYGAYCIAGACALPTLGVGANCITDDDACTAPLRCIGGACQGVAEEGDACGQGQCTIGLSCADGRCAPVSTCGSGMSGDGCLSDEHCAGGFRCDYDAGTCAPAEPLPDAACVAPLVRPRSAHTLLRALVR